MQLQNVQNAVMVFSQLPTSFTGPTAWGKLPLIFYLLFRWKSRLGWSGEDALSCSMPQGKNSGLSGSTWLKYPPLYYVSYEFRLGRHFWFAKASALRLAMYPSAWYGPSRQEMLQESAHHTSTYGLLKEYLRDSRGLAQVFQDLHFRGKYIHFIQNFSTLFCMRTYTHCTKGRGVNN